MANSPDVTPSQPTSPPSTGTIDITGIVEAMREGFVTWGVAAILAAEVAIPGMAWLALPVISSLNKCLTTWILNFLSNNAVMEAFFLDTSMRKASQASDFVAAVNAKKALPATATPQEFADAEAKQMAAFRNFVLLVN